MRDKHIQNEGETRGRMQKEEDIQSGARALQSCDRGSHPSSFLLLTVFSTQ